MLPYQILALTNKFELLYGTYSVFDFQDVFWYIIKKA